MLIRVVKEETLVVLYDLYTLYICTNYNLAVCTYSHLTVCSAGKVLKTVPQMLKKEVRVSLPVCCCSLHCHVVQCVLVGSDVCVSLSVMH